MNAIPEFPATHSAALRASANGPLCVSSAPMSLLDSCNKRTRRASGQAAGS